MLQLVKDAVGNACSAHQQAVGSNMSKYDDFGIVACCSMALDKCVRLCIREKPLALDKSLRGVDCRGCAWPNLNNFWGSSCLRNSTEGVRRYQESKT